MSAPAAIRTGRRRRVAVVFLASGTVAATAAITALLPAASASSHREAPLIAASLDDENLLFRQTYDLQVIDERGRVRQTLVNDVPAAPSNTGAASVPDYRALQQQAVREFDGGGKSYAG